MKKVLIILVLAVVFSHVGFYLGYNVDRDHTLLYRRSKADLLYTLRLIELNQDFDNLALTEEFMNRLTLSLTSIVIFYNNNLNLLDEREIDQTKKLIREMEQLVAEHQLPFLEDKYLSDEVREYIVNGIEKIKTN